MPMFHWKTVEVLKQHATGDILVSADDVEVARMQARAYAKSWLQRSREWIFLDDGSGRVHEEWQDEYDDWMATFEIDIAQEPVVVEVVFINGST